MRLLSGLVLGVIISLPAIMITAAVAEYRWGRERRQVAYYFKRVPPSVGVKSLWAWGEESDGVTECGAALYRLDESTASAFLQRGVKAIAVRGWYETPIPEGYSYEKSPGFRIPRGLDCAHFTEVWVNFLANESMTPGNYFMPTGGSLKGGSSIFIVMLREGIAILSECHQY